MTNHWNALRERLAELQGWQAVMLNREERVMALKQEVNGPSDISMGHASNGEGGSRCKAGNLVGHETGS